MATSEEAEANDRNALITIVPALSHAAPVMSSLELPYRFWAACTLAPCGWTGKRWPSALIADVQGRLHDLANCDHPGALFGNPGGGRCVKCGGPVRLKAVDAFRYELVGTS